MTLEVTQKPDFPQASLSFRELLTDIAELPDHTVLAGGFVPDGNRQLRTQVMATGARESLVSGVDSECCTGRVEGVSHRPVVYQ